MTAAAMAPKTTPPARTDRSVFFNEGVMAASAANGEESTPTIAVEAAVLAESFAFSNLTNYLILTKEINYDLRGL